MADEVTTEDAKPEGAPATAGGNGAPPRSLPMFYQRPEPLQSERHADLKLRSDAGYGFARNTTVIPLNVSEMGVAARDYPVVFVGDGAPLPVAIVGLRQNNNLFVDDQGRWRRNAYVPAYVRRYPFILVTDKERERMTLCADLAADQLDTENGKPLFENGEATETANSALEFSRLYQAHAVATTEAMKVMADEGLFVANQISVTLPDGESLALTDFKVIDHKKFEALDDERFLKLRKVQAIGAVYCHLVSLDKWRDLSAMMA